MKPLLWLLTLPLLAAGDGPVSPVSPAYQDHRHLMVVKDETGKDHPVTTVADWEVRRAHILAHFERVAGRLPGGERRVPLDVQVLKEEDKPRFTLKKIRFAVEPGDRAWAWLLIPKGEANPKSRPAILAFHQTIAIGKDEPAGLGENQELAYARELAERGYVCLAPDYPNFGEYEVDPYKLGYGSATMKGIWNHMRGVDLLCSLPEVDPQRIGAIGHSLGGHNAIFVALFDERIKVVVSSCGFCSFPRYFDGDVAGWSHRGYMPRLKDEFELDLARIPFDFPELIAALAPRPFFTNSPLRDPNFNFKGVQDCLTAATPVYQLYGAAEHLAGAFPGSAHTFPRPVRELAYQFLDARLKPAR